MPAPWKDLRASLTDFLTSAAALSATLFVILFAGVFLIASCIKLVHPRPMIVVQPFEESENAAKSCGLTGKNAEDIFVDRVNYLASEASEFHGNMNSSKHAFGKLPNEPKIPVETALGITIQGVSLDDLMRLGRRVRYDQWNITGDVFLQKGICNIRVRLAKSDSSSEWNIPAPAGVLLPETVGAAADNLIGSASPELVGRALLQEMIAKKNLRNEDDLALDALTEKSFRDWINADPQNETPYFYLLTTLSYEDRDFLVSPLAKWVEDGAPLRKRVSDAEDKIWKKPDERCFCLHRGESIDDKVQMLSIVADLQMKLPIEKEKELKQALDEVSKRNPGETRYLVNSAFASQIIARDLLDPAKTSPVMEKSKKESSDFLQNALEHLVKAARLDSANPGIHRAIGVLMNKQAIARGAFYSPEGVDELMLALYLAPSFPEAFEDAHRYMVAGKQGEKAATLCKVLPLLAPQIDQQSVCLPPVKAVSAETIVNPIIPKVADAPIAASVPR